jgi:glucosamine-6-phosphate deaminase
MNFIDTLKGSMLENFYPAGWDMAKIDACCTHPPETITDRQPHWNDRFTPIACNTLTDFDVMMGHEIALEIKRARDAGQILALILPVGPMGMYRWAVYFLKEWGTPCDHVHGFNMDEWSDGDGNTLDSNDPGAKMPCSKLFTDRWAI